MGITSVRLPIGYWNVVDASIDPSAPAYYTGPTPFKQIDDLIDWAEDLGLTVVLDLHGAVGGQSPQQVLVLPHCQMLRPDGHLRAHQPFFRSCALRRAAACRPVQTGLFGRSRTLKPTHPPTSAAC